jgi:cation diffusion facilitator family transporter
MRVKISSVLPTSASPAQQESHVAIAAERGIRAAQVGMLINAALAGVKLTAGIIGNTYALVADAIESAADVFASLIVWGGLHIGAQPADEDHPYGHGKAEALATAVVSFMLLGAAVGIAFEAVREIRTPHKAPAPWTLGVLVTVVVVKWALARRVGAVSAETGSSAVEADAAHHLSDAITSAAAFIGISLALVGSRVWGGRGWASADDWAALVAAGVIAFNGVSMMRAALYDLMDRMPDDAVVAPIRAAALSIPGVEAIEQLHVRKAGMAYRVTLHVQADGSLPLHEAHVLSGRVKSAIRTAAPRVNYVLVHMEPYLGPVAAR